MAAARQTGADVVSGAVEPVFEADVVPPALPSDFFKPGGMRIKGVDIVNSTANLLLTRRLLVDWQDNWFDNRMAHSGGSDTEFLWRVHRAGHKHAIASDARVYEDISAKRATPDWLLSRAFRNGSSLAVIRIKASGALIGGAREFVSASITVALSSLGMLLSVGDERNKFVSRMKYKRALGKFSTLMGQIYQEYSSSNYR